MSNELTGAFDVVAEFSVPAINRVLAAMHRGKRLLHSASFRVDDRPEGGTHGAIDLAGLALTTSLISTPPNPPVPGSGLAGLLANALDLTFGSGGIVVDDEFSQLKGVAQLQLGAPTISLPPNAVSNGTLHMPVMVRYFPEAGTTVLPEFLHGDISLTLTAIQRNSPVKVIHVDVVGPSGSIHFQQAGTPTLTGPQSAAIDRALRNALITSFQPSNTPLPSAIAEMRFFAMPSKSAVAVLLKFPGSPGEAPGSELFSWNSFFLQNNDQFAIAVGVDFLRAKLLEQTASLDINVPVITGGGFFRYRVTTSVGPVQLDFENGLIVLRISGHTDISIAHAPDINFDFGIRQGLAFVINNGQVQIARVGGVEVDISANMIGKIAGFVSDLDDRIKAGIRTAFNNEFVQSLDEIQQTVSENLSARMLQGFLQKLMNPIVTPPPGVPPPEIVNPTLTLTSAEIRPAGVVLHGQLSVPAFPAPHVEFDLNRSTSFSAHPEYNALNSWIPGGTIRNYVWSYGLGGQPQPPDATKFISSNAPPISNAAIRPVCVRVHGTRLSASGPVVAQPVTFQFCKGLIDTIGGFATLDGASDQGGGGGRPDVAWTDFTVAGKLEFVAHMSPWAPPGTPPNRATNGVIHFPTEKSAAHLDLLPRALAESGRKDAATQIVCVLTTDQISRLKPTEGVLFADDTDGWEKRLQVKSRPATVVLNTSGKVAWRHEGELKSNELAEALKKHLSPGGAYHPRFMELSLRVGQRAPDIIFEYEPGRRLTLRKIAGQPVVMLFFKSTSKPSLDTLRNLQRVFAPFQGDAPVFIAINDGESPEFAKGMAARDECSGMTVVPDPKREISRAYGIHAWPTTLFLDEAGVITDIRHGLITGDQLRFDGNAEPLESQPQPNQKG